MSKSSKYFDIKLTFQQDINDLYATVDPMPMPSIFHTIFPIFSHKIIVNKPVFTTGLGSTIGRVSAAGMGGPRCDPGP